MDDEAAPVPDPAPTRSLATVFQQQKTRRRRGSLRKVALLGRGAQRDKRDSRPSAIVTTHTSPTFSSESDRSASTTDDALGGQPEPDALGLAVSIPPSRPPAGGYAARTNFASLSISVDGVLSHPDRDADGPNVYASTTDEEDVLQIPHGPSPSRPGLSKSAGPDSYFSNRDTVQRQRSFQHARSPLSYTGGLSTGTSPAPDSDWDYSETERWGWVLLCVTWFVFVIGMGSCFDIWSWAWDVGQAPSAPPEFEDDPTLPLIGYYPSLIILTGIMAWVWVFMAWTGMKYFRHAKISGD